MRDKSSRQLERLIIDIDALGEVERARERERSCWVAKQVKPKGGCHNLVLLVLSLHLFQSDSKLRALELFSMGSTRSEATAVAFY